MKLTVKTLNGSRFPITVQDYASVIAVKKNIEDIQGKKNYPCDLQLLIHNGKILEDGTTLLENNVTEGGVLVVMRSKSTTTSSAGTSSMWPVSATASVTPAANTTPPPQPPANPPAPRDTTSSSDVAMANVNNDAYGQAASNLVAGSNRQQIILQLMDIGGGTWDRATVIRALRAAYNNPERAVDYLYSGIPETAVVAAPVTGNASAAGAAAASGLPNSSPLNMFAQEIPAGAGAGAGAVAGPGAGGCARAGRVGALDFLRRNRQFQRLRSMVQTNPRILQPMLQELGKQNAQVLRLIQANQAEFDQLLYGPVEGSEGEMHDQDEPEMPVNVTSAEQEAIERLQAMGFDRALVIEAFLACDRSEELAANYLLEHAGEDSDD